MYVPNHVYMLLWVLLLQTFYKLLPSRTSLGHVHIGSEEPATPTGSERQSCHSDDGGGDADVDVEFGAGRGGGDHSPQQGLADDATTIDAQAALNAAAADQHGVAMVQNSTGSMRHLHAHAMQPCPAQHGAMTDDDDIGDVNVNHAAANDNVLDSIQVAPRVCLRQASFMELLTTNSDDTNLMKQWPGDAVHTDCQFGDSLLQPFESEAQGVIPYTIGTPGPELHTQMQHDLHPTALDQLLACHVTTAGSSGGTMDKHRPTCDAPMQHSRHGLYGAAADDATAMAPAAATIPAAVTAPAPAPTALAETATAPAQTAPAPAAVAVSHGDSQDDGDLGPITPDLKPRPRRRPSRYKQQRQRPQQRQGQQHQHQHQEQQLVQQAYTRHGSGNDSSSSNDSDSDSDSDYRPGVQWYTITGEAVQQNPCKLYNITWGSGRYDVEGSVEYNDGPHKLLTAVAARQQHVNPGICATARAPPAAACRTDAQPNRMTSRKPQGYRQQNAAQTTPVPDRYKGVTPKYTRGKVVYRANAYMVCKAGQTKHNTQIPLGGCFATAREAAAEVDKAYIALQGRGCGRLNFTSDTYTDAQVSATADKVAEMFPGIQWHWQQYTQQQQQQQYYTPQQKQSTGQHHKSSTHNRHLVQQAPHVDHEAVAGKVKRKLTLKKVSRSAATAQLQPAKARRQPQLPQQQPLLPKLLMAQPQLQPVCTQHTGTHTVVHGRQAKLSMKHGMATYRGTAQVESYQGTSSQQCTYEGQQLPTHSTTPSAATAACRKRHHSRNWADVAEIEPIVPQQKKQKTGHSKSLPNKNASIDKPATLTPLCRQRDNSRYKFRGLQNSIAVATDGWPGWLRIQHQDSIAPQHHQSPKEQAALQQVLHDAHDEDDMCHVTRQHGNPAKQACLTHQVQVGVEGGQSAGPTRQPETQQPGIQKSETPPSEAQQNGTQQQADISEGDDFQEVDTDMAQLAADGSLQEYEQLALIFHADLPTRQQQPGSEQAHVIALQHSSMRHADVPEPQQQQHAVAYHMAVSESASGMPLQRDAAGSIDEAPTASLEGVVQSRHDKPTTPMLSCVEQHQHTVIMVEGCHSDDGLLVPGHDAFSVCSCKCGEEYYDAGVDNIDDGCSSDQVEELVLLLEDGDDDGDGDGDG